MDTVWQCHLDTLMPTLLLPLPPVLCLVQVENGKGAMPGAVSAWATLSVAAMHCPTAVPTVACQAETGRLPFK